MARYGRTSAVCTTKSRDQLQDNTGEPILSWTELKAIGKGDIQEEIQWLENKKL